ncbi:hypothetical protein L1049_009124 [Liquidambar formosana]|uniref:Uncharacterized protein n=1 Tax=Liquidambar formosana TaxID=63359 RepID=A0AAP0SBR3_LIQFO
MASSRLLYRSGNTIWAADSHSMFGVELPSHQLFGTLDLRSLHAWCWASISSIFASGVELLSSIIITFPCARIKMIKCGPSQIVIHISRWQEWKNEISAIERFFLSCHIHARWCRVVYIEPGSRRKHRSLKAAQEADKLIKERRVRENMQTPNALKLDEDLRPSQRQIFEIGGNSGKQGNAVDRREFFKFITRSIRNSIQEDKPIVADSMTLEVIDTQAFAIS